jgi:hypothetical protein
MLVRFVRTVVAAGSDIPARLSDIPARLTETFACDASGFR